MNLDAITPEMISGIAGAVNERRVYLKALRRASKMLMQLDSDILGSDIQKSRRFLNDIRAMIVGAIDAPNHYEQIYPRD